MYLEHFGLNEAPFRITPHTDFFFQGANRGATLEALLYAITHDEGIVKVSGEVGSGKTMLCRVLMERLPENVETIFLANPSLSRDEILFTLADELRINLATNRVSAVMRAIQEHLIDLYGKGRQVVVLIDEAHAMPAETLEEIRLLSNLESNRHKLLQIVLFGQPELNEVLGRTEMRQLKERITHNFTLEPLVRSDVASYVEFRMRTAGYKGPSVFSPPALKLVANASLGLTRRINILCDKALLAAFASGVHQITAAHVRAAIRDAEFRGSTLPRAGVWLGAAAAAIMLVGAGVVLFQDGAPASTAPFAAAPSAAPTAPALPAAQASPAQENAPARAPETMAGTAPSAALADKPAEPLPTPPAETSPRVKAGSLGPLTRQHVEETQKWLDSASDHRWFIQLLGTDAGSAGHVENFLASALKLAEPGAIRVYAVEINGQKRLGVIYGEYASRQAASQAMAALPAPLKIYAPYPRQVRRLRN
jgi:type II secretory pathway predicted ATPase ExeA